LDGSDSPGHSPQGRQVSRPDITDQIMRFLKPLAALSLALPLMATQEAQAQSAYTWRGPTLLAAGLNTNGCNLRLPEATHSGSLGLSNIFISVQNRGSAAVRITADVELSGNNSRKAGSISGIIHANPAIASMQAMTPGGSTRDNTTLRVRITSCAPHTP